MTTTEQAVTWVRRLKAIPDRLRQFDVTDRDAHRVYGIDGNLLDILNETGLPCAEDAGGRLWDRFDLSNLSLYLRRPSRRSSRCGGCAGARG